MAPVENQIEIRPMQPEDIDVVLEIDKRISGMERAFTYSELSDGVIGGEISCSFVAVQGDRIIGFVLSTMNYAPDHAAEICMIQGVGIDSAFRRKGIGARLITALVDACRERDVKAIRVITEEHDRELQRLFEALDFRRGRMIDYTRTL